MDFWWLNYLKKLYVAVFYYKKCHWTKARMTWQNDGCKVVLHSWCTNDIKQWETIFSLEKTKVKH